VLLYLEELYFLGKYKKYLHDKISDTPDRFCSFFFFEIIGISTPRHRICNLKKDSCFFPLGIIKILGLCNCLRGL